MIRIIITAGEATESLERVTDPEDAEAAYWRGIVQRTAGPSALIIHPTPGVDALVDSARYRLDRDWRGPREQDMTRWRRLWALPLERGGEPWPGVRPHEVRGLLAAAGWTQVHAAMALGVGPQAMRRWLTDKGSGRAMDYPTWVLLRDLALEAVRERVAHE